MNLKINNTFILGIILAFNLMLINYLGDFNEGSINSYGGIKIILKIISITLICLLSKVNKYFIKSNYLLIIFFIVYLVLVVIRVPFNESRDIMFLNTFISLPLLFGYGPSTAEDFKRFDRLLLWMLLSWVFLDSFFYFTGNSLWHNKAFIGGIGNPSSYGFLLIYIYEVAIFEIKNKRFRFFIRLLIFTIILLSQALMPLLVFILIQFIKLPKKIIFLTLMILFFIGSQLDLFFGFLPDEHWKFKLVALVDFLKTFDVSNTSLSISTRIEFFEGIKLLNSDVLTFLFGNVNDTYYNSGDSQYATYITSFGVPFFLIFIFALGMLYVKASITSLKYFIIAFLLILFTNRILDYWPIAIIIFISINRVNYEYRNNKQFFSQTS